MTVAGRADFVDLFFATFLAGAFLATFLVVFFAAFLAPLFFATFFAGFFDFLAAATRDFALAAFFFVPLTLALRAPLAFLVPFLAAISFAPLV